jgi:hypothetical protein
MPAMKTTLRDRHAYLYEQMAAQLRREIKELEDHFNVARNLACSEWTFRIIPSPTGGRVGKSPTRMKPETMDLLRKNYDMLRKELSELEKVLEDIFRPLLNEK